MVFTFTRARSPRRYTSSESLILIGGSRSAGGASTENTRGARASSMVPPLSDGSQQREASQKACPVTTSHAATSRAQMYSLHDRRGLPTRTGVLTYGEALDAGSDSRL